MQRVLSHRVCIDGRPLAGLTLVTFADDGTFVSAEPFRAESPGTSFTDGTINVCDGTVTVIPASACNDCLQPDLLNHPSLK